jgi:tyrosyl-tRNA synthetase
LHGKKELDNAIEISEAIFKNKINELSKDNFLILIKNIDTFKIKNGTTILEAMELSGFTSSRRETRDFLKNNAFRINGELVSDENIKLTKELSMHDKYLLIQLGKKKTYILEM